MEEQAVQDWGEDLPEELIGQAQDREEALDVLLTHPASGAVVVVVHLVVQDQQEQQRPRCQSHFQRRLVALPGDSDQEGAGQEEEGSVEVDQEGDVAVAG